MNATEVGVQEYSCGSVFLSRLSGFPIVQSALEVTSRLYDKVKDSNSVVSYTLTKGEHMAGRIFAKAGSVVAIGKCQKSITLADNLAGKSLELLQNFFPVIANPTQEISASAKLQMNSTVTKVRQLVDPVVRVAFDIRDKVSHAVTITQQSRLVQYLITVQESVETEQTRIISNIRSVFHLVCERTGIFRVVEVGRRLFNGLKARGLHFIAETQVFVQKLFLRTSEEKNNASSSVMRFYNLTGSQILIVMRGIRETVFRVNPKQSVGESERTEEMQASVKDD